MANVYESIIRLHGDDAREALGILDARGEEAALAHLRRWHEPGEGTLVSTRGDPWKPSDDRFERDDFVVYYDRDAPYIGLVCRVA